MFKNSLKTRRRNKVKKLFSIAIKLCMENGDTPKDIFEEILKLEEAELPDWLSEAHNILMH